MPGSRAVLPDDLTAEVSPFRVVPRSHLSMHADANPYKRYLSHPEEVMVPVKAGGAVLIHHRVFHGNYPNVGDRSRELLAIAYRPAWAGPIAEVPKWDPHELAGLPEPVRPLFADRSPPPLGFRRRQQAAQHDGRTA